MQGEKLSDAAERLLSEFPGRERRPLKVNEARIDGNEYGATLRKAGACMLSYLEKRRGQDGGGIIHYLNPVWHVTQCIVLFSTNYFLRSKTVDYFIDKYLAEDGHALGDSFFSIFRSCNNDDDLADDEDFASEMLGIWIEGWQRIGGGGYSDESVHEGIRECFLFSLGHDLCERMDESARNATDGATRIAWADAKRQLGLVFWRDCVWGAITQDESLDRSCLYLKAYLGMMRGHDPNPVPDPIGRPEFREADGTIWIKRNGTCTDIGAVIAGSMLMSQGALDAHDFIISDVTGLPEAEEFSEYVDDYESSLEQALRARLERAKEWLSLKTGYFDALCALQWFSDMAEASAGDLKYSGVCGIIGKDIRLKSALEEIARLKMKRRYSLDALLRSVAVGFFEERFGEEPSLPELSETGGLNSVGGGKRELSDEELELASSFLRALAPFGAHLYWTLQRGSTVLRDWPTPPTYSTTPRKIGSVDGNVKERQVC